VSATPYFERPLPIGLIFGSFFAIFLPLLALQLVPNFIEWLPYFALVEAVGLGTSHFLITLAVYLQGTNLRYFGSTAQNRLVYFAAPLAILIFFGLTAATELRAKQPLIAAYVFGGLRFFDFFHVGRQSVGMLQIWKRSAPAGLPAWSRRAENAFFVGMACLQWETFALGGRFLADRPYVMLPTLVLAALFVVVLVTYLQRPSAGVPPMREAAAPTYFVMQAACAAAAAYETRLYLVGLTLHYVEYHVIMAPRCLLALGESVQSSDRSLAWFRSRPWLFYVTLLGLTVLFELRNAVGDVSTTTSFFVHMFDGMFLLHYFVEAFLWKFGNPYYRQSLAPLYFESTDRSVAEVADASSAPTSERSIPSKRSGFGPLLIAASLLIALGLAQSQGWLSVITSRLKHSVIDSMSAENHLGWGSALAERGDFARARQHLQRAAAYDAQNAQATALLQWVDTQMLQGKPGK
jgi:hypothetical protein